MKNRHHTDSEYKAQYNWNSGIVDAFGYGYGCGEGDGLGTGYTFGYC